MKTFEERLNDLDEQQVLRNLALFSLVRLNTLIQVDGTFYKLKREMTFNNVLLKDHAFITLEDFDIVKIQGE